MTTAHPENETKAVMSTLPTDEIRQVMWRFSDRYDLQMLIQSTRAVARGTVARLVADKARHSHEWTPEKAEMLKAFDEAGITAAFMDPEDGGYISGPKNLALAMMAFELAWVDAGAATASMANNLALEPIHERGTEEQVHHYMSSCVPPKPGENRKMMRGAFCLTEPLPYVGVDAGMLSGKISIAEWKDGKEPLLQVEKRGRFITNMGYANFVTAAVDTDDPKIKSSCMVILEETDPGVYDRGTPTHKLVHQLSSTQDPAFSLKIPASRIIGGYTVKDGCIVPNFTHSEVIEAVFRRTRVTVAIMSSAKLLSAVEPVMRYQRQRFRGGESGAPGTPRYELGLQQKEDALHRLLDVWATGEASAALGFSAARLFDEFDPLEKAKVKLFADQGIKGPRSEFKALRSVQKDAVEYLNLLNMPEKKRDQKRFQELEAHTLVQYMVKDAVANVLCPASKLWNTGYGATMMREAVSLMGGYGITEDCPGFLPLKWMDAQLEATYEGPEVVQRRQLSITMADELFLMQFDQWIKDLRRIASVRPGTGACTLATAMEMWRWTLDHLLIAKDADGKALYHGQRQGVSFPMADVLCWILSSRQQILDTLELESKGATNPVLAESLPGFVNFFTDLCHIQAARTAGEVARVCAELNFGYNRHPSWEKDDDRCFAADDLNDMEGTMAGICGCARAMGDVIESDGSHECKAGPCVSFRGLEAFSRLRVKLDGCLTGCRLAKDRAAQVLAQIMIPEALDYPQ